LLSKKASAATVLLFFLAGMGLFPALPARAAELVERIVARVNEDIIMLSELEEAVRAYSEKIHSMGYEADKEQILLSRARSDVLDQLVNQKLTDQQVKRLNLSVSEKDIDRTVERLLASQSLTQQQLTEWLAREGISYDNYRKQIREQMLRSKVVNIEVKSKIVVTKDEVDAYYQRNIEKYGGSLRVHLRTLLIRVPGDAAAQAKQAAREQMEAIAKALQAGKPSEDPSVERIDLGWFAFHELSPQIQGLIKGLKAGQFTGVLSVEQGFQIILVDELEAQAGKGLDTVAGQIEEELYKAKVDEKFTAWLKELRQRSHIKLLD